MHVRVCMVLQSKAKIVINQRSVQDFANDRSSRWDCCNTFRGRGGGQGTTHTNRWPSAHHKRITTTNRLLRYCTSQLQNIPIGNSQIKPEHFPPGIKIYYRAVNSRETVGKHSRNQKQIFDDSNNPNHVKNRILIY